MTSLCEGAICALSHHPKSFFLTLILVVGAVMMVMFPEISS